jgi:hypothetical protein
VTKLMRDHQLTHGDALGRHKLLGGGDRGLSEGHTFGAPSAREGEPCVGELIRCGYSQQEQEPDADLGKSLREGWRAAAGIASYKPAHAPANGGIGGKSSCMTSSVRQLLAPPHWAEIGVTEQQLQAQRGREGIAALAVAAGVTFSSEGEFNELFQAAASAGAEGDGGSCSLARFMEARQQWLRQQVGV